MEDYKKLYEQTQRRMKEFIKRWDGIKLSSNDLFTEELKQIVEIESKDEKIRKALISVLTSDFEKDTTIDGITVKEIVVWLEKQGEQKSYGQRKECLDCQFNYVGGCKGSCAMKRSDPNPAWSEEDETNSYHLKTLFENLAKDIKYDFRIISDNDRDKYTAWLKSLKDRVQTQPKQEWSEEDKDMVENILGTYKTLEDMLDLSTGQDQDILTSMNFERDWLKQLKQRMGG